MKTIRLLYPDYVSGGLETYYFGAHLMAHILPENERQPLVKVKIAPPDGWEKRVNRWHLRKGGGSCRHSRGHEGN